MAKTQRMADPAEQSVALRPVTRLGAPALAIVETRSLALGFLLADAAAKRAPVQLMACRPICPGRFLIAISGETEAVRQSHQAMLDLAAEAAETGAGGAATTTGPDGIGMALGGPGDEPLSEILITQLHEAVLPALRGEPLGEVVGSLAFIETTCAAAAVLAADTAAKEAPVHLREIQLAQGLGGKGFVQLTGDLANLEAAVARGAGAAAARGELVRQVIIPRLHPDVVDYL